MLLKKKKFIEFSLLVNSDDLEGEKILFYFFYLNQSSYE